LTSILVGTTDTPGRLESHLKQEFVALRDRGVAVDLRLARRGPLTFLSCEAHPIDGCDPEVASSRFKIELSRALADLIVERWEDQIIRRIIRTHYYYFTSRDQERIFELVKGEQEEGPYLFLRDRRSLITRRLLDYLSENRELLLEGFVTFRLREYVEELEDAVDRAVDEFLMEREHWKFVRLLKCFMEEQEPRLELVHVLLSARGTFKLLDEEGGLVDSRYLEDFILELVEGNVNHEDLLISALITIAPKKVVLHCDRRIALRETVRTIRDVFDDRLRICDGCQLCVAPPEER